MTQRKRPVRFPSPAWILLGAWLLAALVARPFGDFPLNDDWSFGRTVLRLLREGTFRPEGWTSMPLLVHSLWGAALCQVFGFSFRALHLGAVLVGGAGLLAVRRLCRAAEGEEGLAVLLAASLGACPIYFNLSCTYMTDVPFVAIVCLAAAYGLESLRTGRDRPLLVFATLSVLATLVRQVGLCAGAAFALAQLLRRPFSLRRSLLGAVPLALSVLSLVALRGWLVRAGHLPDLYDQNLADLRSSLAQPLVVLLGRGADRIALSLGYIGAFLLPLLLVTEGRRRAAPAFSFPVRWSAGLLAVGWAVLRLRPSSGFFPFCPNVVWNLGVGPPTLSDAYILGLRGAPAAPPWLATMLPAVMLAGGTLLAVRLAGVLVAEVADGTLLRGEGTLVFLGSLVAASVVPLLPGTIFMDRYLLPAVPFVGVLLGATCRLRRPYPPARVVAAAAVWLLLATLGVGGTRDYYAWNEARWRALGDLEREGVPPTAIDGGFEYNGWTCYRSDWDLTRQKPWWIHDDRYRIAFGPVDGFREFRRYGFDRWLPPGAGEILVLERIGPR